MEDPSPHRDWLSASDAARYLDVSRERVHQLVKANALVSDKIAGRLVVLRHDVEKWDRNRNRRKSSRPYTLADLRLRRDSILALAGAHGAGNVRVFGSVATGDADQHSDIDLAVDIEPSRNVIDIASLAADLEDLLGCRVDLLIASEGNRDLSTLLSEAVPI